MNILIDVNHPAHVHLFRHAAQAWIKNGDQVLFTATRKDVALDLLSAYDLPHQVIYTRRAGTLNLMRELVVRSAKLISVARGFAPDALLSVGSPTAAFAAWSLRRPHIAFEDTEDSLGQIWLYRPFTTHICVPDCFMHDLGPKMTRYAGYHELAYLHPQHFIPNPIKIDPLSTREPFYVVRFITWDAAHDGGETGLSAKGKDLLLQMLLKHGRVVLSVEKKPPVLLDANGNDGQSLSADAMHHLLAYAQLYVGEGVTAASEAAVLGTPSLLINSRQVGYLQEQETRYNLAFTIADEGDALAKLGKLLAQPDLKNVWQIRQAVLLRDKIDVTAWLMDVVAEVVARHAG